MRTAKEIYDSEPFEDEFGDLIPHDKLAIKVAEKYAEQFIKWRPARNVTLTHLVYAGKKFITKENENGEITHFFQFK